MLRRFALAALALTLASPALANDSEAEVGIGGITLKPSSAIVMASEDLYISPELVRVKYRFANPTDRRIDTTVAFPMPGQPRGMAETWFFMEEKEDWSGFDFNTKVDGRPVRLQMIERAMIGTRDVTDLLAKHDLPVTWFTDKAFMARFEKMTEVERVPWLKDGLLRADPLFKSKVVPAWDAVTFFVRDESFPPNSSVTVEHEYVPRSGGSVGGALYPNYRKEFPRTVQQYRDRYCVDDHFLAGVDRRLGAKLAPGKQRVMSETWLAYVLSSGANWKGPIGDFRLVVDKGTAENLVSFCMDGVKKIGPTQFEVRKTNFEPKDDLKILIARFHEYDDG
ncbi:MAG: DUF4424 family protein [Novosphingobium sp.]|nr:DUF4424 family protein [Novosphingobium sp.]